MPESDRPGTRERTTAWGIGLAQALLWVAFASLSWHFAYEGDVLQRPFGSLGLVAALAFAAYLFCTLWFWGERGRRVRATDVVWLALLMRLPLVFGSSPVQEIDYYRYLWDGRAVVEGVSPYRYSPADLDSVLAGETDVPSEEAGELVDLLSRSPAVATVFERIAHREVPSVYPPVAQSIFALAAILTPEEAPVYAHLVVLRGLLSLFDVGTVLLLLALLRRAGLPAGRGVAYAWCPLVLKEFANTAHMDTIPVFFSTAAFLAFVAAWQRAEPRRIASDGPMVGDDESRSPLPPPPLLWAWAALLALAILAKWYPLILLPLFAAFGWHRWRKMMLPPLGGVALAVVLGSLLLSPGSPDRASPSPAATSEGTDAEAAANSTTSPHDEWSGLSTFLRRWEMNDLVFNVVRENLRIREDGVDPWYSVVPLKWRERWEASVRELTDRLPERFAAPAPAFLAAQLVCGGLLLAIVLALCRRRLEGEPVVRAGYCLLLALAATWYLSATQNPWYWTWSLPFVVFARSTVWLWVSGAAFLYYARFWLIYHYPEPVWAGLNGRRLFDEVVVWIEHGPLLVAILVVWGSLEFGVSRAGTELRNAGPETVSRE